MSTEKKKTASKGELFKEAGWVILGGLLPAWSRTYQQNFNDMEIKFAQLGIRTLLPENFYFSQGIYYDFIQILSAPSHEKMVAYSVWFAAQGWGHFSPMPVMEYTSESTGQIPKEKDVTIVPNMDIENPAGWYILGTFDRDWYLNLGENLEKARQKRLGFCIRDVTPLYFTQGSRFSCVQLLEASSAGKIMEYTAWFAAEGFGCLVSTPYMDTTMVQQALFDAARNP